MPGLRCTTKHIIAIFLAFSASHQIAAQPDIDGFGLRAEAVYRLGNKHAAQDRWVTNFALANSAQLIRHATPIANLQRLPIDDLNYEPAFAAFQDRSPFAIQFTLSSHGDHTTQLWGVPVAAKISPVRSANGEGSSWVANPWVWVGALAVGGALASGGGGSGGGGDSGSGSNNDSANSGTTLVGGDDCNVVSVSDSGPELVSGCGVAGTEINVP